MFGRKKRTGGKKIAGFWIKDNRENWKKPEIVRKFGSRRSKTRNWAERNEGEIGSGTWGKKQFDWYFTEVHWKLRAGTWEDQREWKDNDGIVNFWFYTILGFKNAFRMNSI